jgi:hypothetical protein
VLLRADLPASDEADPDWTFHQLPPYGGLIFSVNFSCRPGLTAEGARRAPPLLDRAKPSRPRSL